MVSPKSSKVFFKDKQDKTCLLLLLKEKKKQSLKFENYTYLMSTHQFFFGGGHTFCMWNFLGSNPCPLQ